VLLPGDPGRALALAQELLAEPRMFNHNRGLWGYTGLAGDGEPLTIQATGIGGPSAAIVLEELIALGATRAIRVGTAAALEPAEPVRGRPLIVERALCADGTSRALGAGDWAPADRGLFEALTRSAPDAARCAIVSSDLAAGHERAPRERWRAAGAAAADTQTAALFALGALRGVAVACVLATSAGAAERELEAALACGRVAAAALSVS